MILNSTQITDETIPHLAGFKKLKTLHLYQTNLSPAVLEELRQALPKTRVFHALPKQEGNTGERKPLLTLSGNSTAKLQPIQPPVKTRLDSNLQPDFQRHVIPLLGRLGCNSRNCHGSFQGRGGFRLSMFGYDFDEDHKNLKKRINREKPAESLITTHPTNEDEHGGGLRLQPGSWQQKLLNRWIESGASGLNEKPPTFARLEVTPQEIVFQKNGQTRQLKAVRGLVERTARGCHLPDPV